MNLSYWTIKVDNKTNYIKIDLASNFYIPIVSFETLIINNKLLYGKKYDVNIGNKTIFKGILSKGINIFGENTVPFSAILYDSTEIIIYDTNLFTEDTVNILYKLSEYQPRPFTEVNIPWIIDNKITRLIITEGILNNFTYN